MEIDLFTISKAPYYHNKAFHQGLHCLVDIHPTFYLGGSTIGADEAINDARWPYWMTSSSIFRMRS